MLIVYNLCILKEKCIKNEKKAQNITKIKSCMIRKEKQNEKKQKRCNRCGCKRERERESRRVRKTCSLFDALNSTKNIYKRMDYAESLNKNASAFSKNSLSFLCALRDETIKNRRYTEEIKRKQKNKLASERGITLLSLIITVVIMIILAAVTISVTLGDGGLVDQAKWAAEQTANSTQSEQEQLDDVASQVNEIIAGIGGGTGGGVTNTTPGEDTNQIEETNTVETNTIDPEPEPPEPLPDGTISIGEPQWQPGGTAKVSVTSSEGSYIIQYQINGTDEDGWETVQSGVVTGVKHGDTVYARITDGEQYSNPQNKKIEDLAAPEKANIELTPANVLVGENITAKVTHVDNETGVDIENSKWVMNQSSNEIGTSDTSAYTGSFTTNGETITLDSSNAGTYYLHVLTTDVAGNKTETVSSAITISAITGTVSKSGDVSWNAGQASISLATTESQYTIVYKINGEGSWQTYNGTSITGLSHGDTVTACLTNASQTTYGPEAEFEIQDTTNPTVTVTAQGSPSTNSITVTAQAVDNESGMKAEPTYTFQIKQSSQGSYTTPSGAENISNATYTFTGLTQGTSYDIQVIVNGDNAGRTGTGTTQATTDTVPGADEGLETGTITASPVAWSGGKASTTLTTTTSFQIQYQVGGISEESWSSPANSPVTVSNLDHGSIVYARLTDGTNAGNYAAINILDGTPPTVSVEVGEVTYNSIEVTVTAEDKESGLADRNAYRYYLNDEPTPRATSNSNTYTYEGLTGSTDYTIKVEVVDKAGTPGTETAQATTEKAPATNVNELVAGDYVYYEDGQGTRQLCAVLYDSSSPYGVEIITMNTVEDVELGNGTGSMQTNNTTYFNTAKNSYNNAIATLNNATSKYINTTYADKARSVGSDPSNPTSDNPGYFTSSYSYMSNYNGQFKNADEHHETDYNQMGTLGIRDIDEYYWLASRHVPSDSNYSSFGVRYVTGGSLGTYNLCYVYSSGITTSFSKSYGLRPVFHLRDTVQVTGGTGAKDDPYILYAEPLPEASESETQVANYADVDGNGTVDGIIYADLAIGGSGTGLGQSYTIPTSSGFKKYQVTQESYTPEGAAAGFGTGKVIAPVSGSSGNERFYVMALADVDGNRNGTYYTWYDAAYGQMNDYASTTSTEFGRGEQNTINMIAKWNASDYGPQNDHSSHDDMWGLSAVNSRTWNGSDGWYVPSKGEWAAFAGQLGIDDYNYSSKGGLSYSYWSSSQYSANRAWYASFISDTFNNAGHVDSGVYVRLGTTF